MAESTQLPRPAPQLTWQPTLFATGEIGVDDAFSGLERRPLGDDAWVDHVPDWVRGADELFAQLLGAVAWEQRSMHMYERRVREPRLTARYRLTEAPPPLPILDDMAQTLSDRYDVSFTSVGCNLYRDGADSVAWHGDRVARELPEATVAVVSLGDTRPFKLRPRGGGAAITLLPGPGDLLVMGGSCQRTWDHSVPKVRKAGPRISVQFRHAYDR